MNNLNTEAPSFLKTKGRGRGRGRGDIKKQQRDNENLISKEPDKFINEEKTKNTETNNSSSPEDKEGSNGHESFMTDIFKGYTKDNEFDDLGKTSNFVKRFISKEDDPCIVCLDEINRPDPIWSCLHCFASYHLQCIQRWIREACQQRQLLGVEDDAFPSLVEPRREVDARREERRAREANWPCPTCRTEYTTEQKPNRYYCFCGKVEDPDNDPWILAHSCGGRCDRPLESPPCGHRCLLLCHPGPCPPCPQSLSLACHCGRAPPRRVRCGHRGWSCGTQCSRVLACGQHRCEEGCHEGSCPPCSKTSWQRCQCGRERAVRPCSQSDWHCLQVCERALDCGQHTCQRVCHQGACGPCPHEGQKSCPCGKTLVTSSSCTEVVPPCPQTCQRSLECGLHTCTQPCHLGDCAACKERVVKVCRCGSFKSQIECCREQLCSTKCARLKDCGRHACKRRCCTGGEGVCAACTQLCGRPLPCRNHRCQAQCHRGPCYPCTERVVLVCPCGGSQRQVNCGAEKNPRFQVVCKKKCHRPSLCRHPNLHPCHSDAVQCPRCSEECGGALSGCSHQCRARCHDAVPTRVRQDRSKMAGPWQIGLEDGRMEMLSEPCPPCQHAVLLWCRGGHEEFSIPCSEQRELSCGRACGRQLVCGNHPCSLECHSVDGSTPDGLASTTCLECTQSCQLPRPLGCTHKCSLEGCHPKPCPPCPRLVPLLCHCASMTLNFPCREVAGLSRDLLTKQLSCPGRCPRSLDSCGHRCSRDCHPGQCADPSLRCTAKVSVVCPCGGRKVQLPCWKVADGAAKVLCLPEKCDAYKLKKLASAKSEVREDKEESPDCSESGAPRRGGPSRKAKRRNRGEGDTGLERQQGFLTGINWLFWLRRICVVLITCGIIVWAILEARKV